MGRTHLVGILGMDEDLFVLFEPSVHLRELELDESVELVIVVYGRSGFRAAVVHDDVVNVMFLGLEGIDEILLGHVLGLEEIVRVVWLQPAARPRRSEKRER